MANATDYPESDHFRGEYELELERWFRRRFGWLCVAFLVWGGFSAVTVAAGLIFGWGEPGPGGFRDSQLTRDTLTTFLTVASTLATLAIVLHFWLRVRPGIETRDAAVRSATIMILALGAVNFAFELSILLSSPQAPIVPLFSLVFWHLMASLFLPWTPRESLRPILPLLAAWTIWHAARGFLDGEVVQTIVEVALAPLVLVPGMAVAWGRLMRHRSKFRREVSRKFFVSMRRELQQARRIHESLFPQPVDDAVFRFEYRYRPAQEVGGDFVHMWTDHQGVAHLAIIDVTGHGLAAAMTVNRLYGELERLRYEHPYLRPGSLLSLLNRYVLLTLGPHRIFATAAILRLDPRDGTLMYANAGHPPPFHRNRNGQVMDLDSTQPMLGALQPQDFGVEDATIVLEPGDTIVAYTDGAFEARNRKGHKMGLSRLREALRRNPPPPAWPEFLMQLVVGFSGGGIDDDVLLASLHYQGKPSGTLRRSSPELETADVIVTL